MMRGKSTFLSFAIAVCIALVFAIAPAVALADDDGLQAGEIELSEQRSLAPDYTVYHAVSSTSGIYHLDCTCSGMRNYETMTYSEAIAKGYRACKLCAGGSDADDDSAAGTKTMYRLYNPNSGEHFYTSSMAERNKIVNAGWQFEGVGWIAPAESSTPVYRLYSGTDHHYTTSEKECKGLIKAGWKYEGIGWYSADATDGVPLYRQFNPYVNPKASRNNSGSHNYTTSKAENDKLVKIGWKAEGVGWYGVK